MNSEGTLKLTLTMIASNEKKTTKSFDNIPPGENVAADNAALKAHANKYKKLTDSVLTTAKKTTTTPLSLT